MSLVSMTGFAEAPGAHGSLRWRWEAMQTGRTVAEVALSHSLVYRVEHVFLFNRDSGLLMLARSHAASSAQHLDVIPGMLTAIQDFVRDSFGLPEGAGLRSIRFGEYMVLVEHGAFASLAAAIRGTPPPDFQLTLAEALERHLQKRQRPRIIISDEREALMGTGGGIAKALPQLGETPFFLVNSDTLWLDGVRPNFVRLAEAFDAATMDALLLLAAATGSIGYEGRGDYAMLPDGRLQRRAEREVVPFVYAGAAILAPGLFAGAPAGAFPLTRLFDRAGEQGRLFGLRLEGVWMHVGTPDAVAAAEAALTAAH